MTRTGQLDFFDPPPPRPPANWTFPPPVHPSMADCPRRGTRGPVPTAPHVRFWRMVEWSADGCWLWRGTRGELGYGRFRLSVPVRRSINASRMAWILVHGPIPSDLYVCHRCDNPTCVNPAHLFLGTQYDNMRDASRKGRLIDGHRRAAAKTRGRYAGERNPQARLTRALVDEIRHRVLIGHESHSAVAASVGVCRQHVSSIVAGQVWRDADASANAAV